MHAIVTEFLREHGQMAAPELLANIDVDDSAKLEAILNALVKEGSLGRSPRGNYYVPGHVARLEKCKRVATAGSAVVAFGVDTPEGRGFECGTRLVMPGDVLTNRELTDMFRVGNSAGIRVSKATGSILLIASAQNALYKDRWQDDVFMYTGEGALGDQAMTRGNLAIADSVQSGRPLLLFFKRRVNAYEFQGEVRLSAAPDDEQQPDETGLMRRVWVFALRAIENVGPPLV